MRAFSVLSTMLLVLLAQPAHAAEPEQEQNLQVPSAVADSLGPGGTAFEKAQEFRGLNPDGTFAASRRSGTASYTNPIRYEYLEITEWKSSVLSEDDFADRGDNYIAVELVNGKPGATLEVTRDGEFVAYGDYFNDVSSQLARLDNRRVLLTDGRFNEVYTAAPDLRSVKALNVHARELIGNGNVSVKRFRELKGAQEDAITPVATDEVGGIPFADATSDREIPGILVALFGAGMIAIAAYLLGRGRRSTASDR